MSTSAPSSELEFITGICDMCRRGDIAAIVDSLKEYWSDRTRQPWHRVYEILESQKRAFQSERELADVLLLLRDAVFGAVHAHSLSLAVDVRTRDLLDTILSGQNWNEGRQRARALLLEQAMEKIAKKRVEHLVVSGLLHDGFRQAATALLQVQLEQYRQARPTPADGKIDLKRLARSVYGAQLLRQLEILDSEISLDDPRTPQLLEAYDKSLVELETDAISKMDLTDEDAQTTMAAGRTSGTEIQQTDATQQVLTASDKSSATDVSETTQMPLTYYLTSDTHKPERPTRRRRPVDKAVSRRHRQQENDASMSDSRGEAD